MEAEGVNFHYNQNVGVDVPLAQVLASHDAVLMAGGAERPRDPGLPGTELEGCHYAMPFLVQQNRRVGGEDVSGEEPLLAGGKHVIVIGGGDTASDCIGTSFRQGALSVTQLDIRPQPPVREDKLNIWPYWPTKLRTSSSQAEGAEREFAAATLAVVGEDGVVIGVQCARVDEKRQPVEGTEFILRADLVLIAIGFAGAVLDTAVAEAGIEHTGGPRAVIKANDRDYRTNVDKLWAAGDIRRGQSLVVWAIREGRPHAKSIWS